MKTKRIIILSILMALASFSAFSADNNYVPEFMIYIQPKNGSRFNVNEYHSLTIGQEYILQIVLYVKTRAWFFPEENIRSRLVFEDPSIDIYEYPHHLKLSENLKDLDYIYFDFDTPVFKTTPKDDKTDMILLNFRFIPRSTREQIIYLYFDNTYIDEKYEKNFSLHFDAAE